MESQLIRWEQIYGAQEGDWSNSIRFMNVIRAAFRKTGQRTVILIDVDRQKRIPDTFNGWTGIIQGRRGVRQSDTEYRKMADRLKK